ncbi:MAG TPA: ATP-grasp domain-containing protein [Pyrinomonadaceae bacterium]
MNLLVPNITWVSALNVARSLRPYCDKLYGTVTPLLRPKALQTDAVNNLIYTTGTALFDRVFDGSMPAKPEEEAEEAAAYVERILDVCRRYRVDTIYPSNDVEMRIVAKYSERFVAEGVTPVVSSYESLLLSQDKFEVGRLAEEVGFPCVQTVLCESEAQALEAAGRLGYPLVLKSAFSRGSYGVRFVGSGEQLRAEMADLLKTDDRLILQEYIPGNRERSFNLLLGLDGEPLLTFTLRKMHYLKPSMSTAIEVVESPPEMEAAVKLMRRMGVAGFCSIQTKVDERDGKYKLIEVNARFGSNARIFFRFPNNLPLATVDIFRGERPSVQEYPVGLKGVSPFEDLLAWLPYLSVKYLGAQEGDELLVSNPPPALKSMAKSYARLYRSCPIVDDNAAVLLSDPVCTLRFYAWLLKSMTALPKHWRFFLPWGDI